MLFPKNSQIPERAYDAQVDDAEAKKSKNISSGAFFWIGFLSEEWLGHVFMHFKATKIREKVEEEFVALLLKQDQFN